MGNLTSTDLIALYAAIVSTIAVGWNIFNEIYRKRTRLKITVHRAVIEGPDGTKEEQVALLVVNVGHVSCVLRQAGFEINKGGFQIFPGEGKTSDWTDKLEPAHMHSVAISRYLLEKNGIHPPFRGAFVIDSTGKKYRARKGMGNK